MNWTEVLCPWPALRGARAQVRMLRREVAVLRAELRAAQRNVMRGTDGRYAKARPQEVPE